MTNLPLVSSLHFYPIKSCAAVDLQSAVVGQRGLTIGDITDRNWMLIDANDKLVSQREIPAMAQIKIDLLPGTMGMSDVIQVFAPLKPSIILDPTSYSDERQRVIIHGKEAIGHKVDAASDAWFSAFLGKQVRLILQTPEDVRLCDKNFAVTPGQDIVSFADGMPYLITNEMTLLELNNNLVDAVPMSRFRPNIVITSDKPEAEYGWGKIKIGTAAFALTKPCTRCIMTTVDQDLGVRMGTEPLATLAKTNFLSEMYGEGRVHGAIFGENAIPLNQGTISVGDVVEVTEMQPMPNFRRNLLTAQM